MAIANYEDRFVIPTAHRELDEDAYDLRGSCGFSFGNGCSAAPARPTCSARQARPHPYGGCVMTRTFKVLSALLTYPTAELQDAAADPACHRREGLCRAIIASSSA